MTYAGPMEPGCGDVHFALWLSAIQVLQNLEFEINSNLRRELWTQHVPVEMSVL